MGHRRNDSISSTSTVDSTVRPSTKNTGKNLDEIHQKLDIGKNLCKNQVCIFAHSESVFSLPIMFLC